MLKEDRLNTKYVALDNCLPKA